MTRRQCRVLFKTPFLQSSVNTSGICIPVLLYGQRLVYLRLLHNVMAFITSEIHHGNFTCRNASYVLFLTREEDRPKKGLKSYIFAHASFQVIKEQCFQQSIFWHLSLCWLLESWRVQPPTPMAISSFRYPLPSGSALLVHSTLSKGTINARCSF